MASMDKQIKKIYDLYNKMQNDMILNIAEEFNAKDIAGGSVEWQQSTILGNKKLQEKQAKVFVKNRYKIAEAFRELERSAIVIPKNRVSNKMQGYLDAFSSNNNNFISLTAGTSLEFADKAFVKTINDVYLETATGLTSYDQSLNKAVNKLAAKGIGGQTMSNGSFMNLASAIRRQVVTTTTQVSRSVQEEYARNYDLEVYQISSHAGARELCEPYQGKFYSDYGSGTIKDSDGNIIRYEDIGSTSYGEPAGLFGINCTHQKYYVEQGNFKDTEPKYTKKENAVQRDIRTERRKLENNSKKYSLKIKLDKAINDDYSLAKNKEKLSIANKNLKSFNKKHF